MRCKNCETEFDPRTGDCPVCGAVPELDAEVLRRDERDAFAGVTIEEDGGRSEEPRFDNRRDSSSGIYVKQVSVSSSFWSQIIFFLIIAFVIFFVLPAFLIFFLLLAAVWFILKLFR